MKYICLDIEMTEAKGNKQKRLLRGLNNEIIEIGAVMLDSKYNYLDCISIPVKPEYTTVTEFIEKLTGISNRSLKEAETLPEAFKKYFSWCGTEEFTTFCWGQNDFLQLWNELYRKIGFAEKYFESLKTFTDLQAIFSSLLKAKSHFSLDAALKTVGCSFKGYRHSALGDAFNTARILNKIATAKDFTPDIAKLYDNTTPIYDEKNKRYRQTKYDTVSFGAFMPQQLLEKYGIPTPLSHKQTEVPKQQRRTPQKKSFLDTVVQKLTPKSSCAKYDVAVKNYFCFRTKMLLKRDLRCTEQCLSPRKAIVNSYRVQKDSHWIFSA